MCLVCVFARAASTIELLSPQQPGVIGAEDVQSPTGAEALADRCAAAAVGRDGRCDVDVGGSAGTLADEWMSGDTFFQTDETDRRTIPTNNSQVSGASTRTRRSRAGTR